MIEQLKIIWLGMSMQMKFVAFGVVFLISTFFVFSLFFGGTTSTPPCPPIVFGEVVFSPAQNQFQSAELKNLSWDGPFAGLALTNEKGERYLLPSATPQIARGERLRVVFDGENRVEGNTVHADRRAFLNNESGFGELYGPDRVLFDRVVWNGGKIKDRERGACGAASYSDKDNDGGGCNDGEEDKNFNGKRDGGEAYNFNKEDDKCGTGLYAWEGTINVEVSFNGQKRIANTTGKYKWIAEYQAKLLEVPTNSTKDGFLLNNLVPVEFAYTIHADHNLVSYGGGKYSSVTYAGVASGRIVADVVNGLHKPGPRYITGNLARITTANFARFSVPASFSSGQEYGLYQNTMPREGWYGINVDFRRGLSWDSRDGESGEGVKRMRDMYRGIGGTQPPFFGEPNRDFIHFMPTWMPGGTAVMGQLDTPGQREVRGTFFILQEKSDVTDDPVKITVSWYFKRTPRVAEICEGCVDERIHRIRER